MLTKEQAYPVVKQMREQWLTAPQIYREIMKRGGVKCKGGVLKESSVYSLALYGPSLVKSHHVSVKTQSRKTRAPLGYRPSSQAVGKAIEMLRSELPENVKIEVALYYLKG